MMIIRALILCATAISSVAGESATPDDVPTAPAAYRRPKDWKPSAPYPKTIREISAEESAKTMARADAEMARVDQVNRTGKYRATLESLATHACPEWFVDAKLGIFLDWGPYSIASWAVSTDRKYGRVYSDWYEYLCRDDGTDPKNEPFRQYHLKNWGADFKCDHFLGLFRGEKFDAPALMKVFKASGARYVVPFLKHHGGYCLWDCSYTRRDSVDMAAGRDFAREMREACRKEGLKFGFYESQCGEWEYPRLAADGTIEVACLGKQKSGYSYSPLTPDVEWKASGKVAVRDLVRQYFIPQAVEFIDRYDPDLFWGDYDWVTRLSENGSLDMIAYFYNRAEGRKEVAMNDRFGLFEPGDPRVKARDGSPVARCAAGDFHTDEWGDNAQTIDPRTWHPWESCSGISKCYGNYWAETEAMVMSDKAFICHFTSIVARGGNLLLLVNLNGPGEIPAVQKKRLESIGRWLAMNGEAIYGTRIIAPYSTKSIDYTQSKDHSVVYAIVKNPGERVVLECSMPSGAKITGLTGGQVLESRRTPAGVEVVLPEALRKSELPIVLRCE